MPTAPAGEPTGNPAAAEPLDRNDPAIRATARDGRPAYCAVDFGVGTIRVTTIADRSRYSGTRGAILVFQ